MSNVFDFCNNLGGGKNGDGSECIPAVPGDKGPYSSCSTYAVIIGKEDDRHDSEYMIFPKKETVKSGKTHKLKIRRNNVEHRGVIIFTAYLRPDDTARVVGITEGLTSGGDLERGATLPDTKFGKVPKKKEEKYQQQFPQKKNYNFF